MISGQKNYSQIKISGDAIFPVIRAITDDAECKAFFDKHGLSDIQKGIFYPIENYLSLLSEIENRMPILLKRIGMFIMSEAIFPPGINSFKDALMQTDQAYYMNHQGIENEEIGHYLFKNISKNSYQMSVTSLYPCLFDHGIILGMAEKFDTDISVEHSPEACRSNGEAKCDYHISIKI